jgi:putative transposase
MGRTTRVDIGDEIYHVLNRANGRLTLFFKESDYLLLEVILADGVEKFGMRILAYCVMPNHFHLVLHPRKDGDLQKFMQWVTLTHTQRWHAQHRTIGTGHLYQGRYKSFLIEKDDHLLSVVRYIERNPLRAKLVKKLDNWKYSSYLKRITHTPAFLAPLPIDTPRNYTSFVYAPQTIAELDAVRYSVNKGKPYGTNTWTHAKIKEFALDATVRKRGRPRNGT